jgi:hypothetical protein
LDTTSCATKAVQRIVQAAFDNPVHLLAGEAPDHLQNGINPVARSRA